jgi:hypothetical protein
MAEEQACLHGSTEAKLTVKSRIPLFSHSGMV